MKIYSSDWQSCAAKAKRVKVFRPFRNGYRVACLWRDVEKVIPDTCTHSLQVRRYLPENPEFVSPTTVPYGWYEWG